MSTEVEYKSPFLVIQNFLSPLTCEKIVDSIPRYNLKMSTVIDEDSTDRIIYKNVGAPFLSKPIFEVISKIEQYYDVVGKQVEDAFIEWFPVGHEGKLRCDNSSYFARKWIRDEARDFSGVIFLSDFNTKGPFDTSYEVYGGKLEFPQHTFGFQPQRGTLVVYPSGPHFINYTTKIQLGDLYQVRFYIEAEKIYLYNPADFQGDYRVWFKETA